MVIDGWIVISKLVVSGLARGIDDPVRVSAFLWPGITLLTLIVLFGVYAIVDGIVAIWTGLSRTKESPRWWTFLLENMKHPEFNLSRF